MLALAQQFYLATEIAVQALGWAGSRSEFSRVEAVLAYQCATMKAHLAATAAKS